MTAPPPDFTARCYLCDAPCHPTRHAEHIPPRRCFPSGTENLITVPSCLSCNNANSRADEYFRMVTTLSPRQTPSSIEVFNRALDRTVRRGRLKREIAELTKSVRDFHHDGQSLGKVSIRARPLRLQVIRITKGFIRHFYPDVDHSGFEWDVHFLNQLRLDMLVHDAAAMLRYHERGNGAHQLLYGMAEDAPGVGMWVHIFHGGQGYLVAHRPRCAGYRKHSGVHFHSLM